MADEELVDALSRGGEQLENRLLAVARQQLPGCGIVSVKLESVEPADSVLIRLLLVVETKRSVLASVTRLAPAVIVAVGELLEDALGTAVAVSASPRRPVRTTSPTTLWGRLSPFLAAIGTGVGVIGFVTFVGGIIVSARAQAAGIPAAPTLGVFPRQDLLVIGAETLAPLVIRALSPVIFLALCYAAVRRVMYQRFRDWRTAHEAAFLAGETTRAVAASMFVFVLFAWSFPLAKDFGALDNDHRAYAILTIILSAAVAGAVGSRTRRFLPLATTTFVLAGAFLACIAYWRAHDEEHVRGAAIVREHKRAIAGIFVAEGAGRVYLARLTIRRNGTIATAKSSLVGIAKGEISDIAIGDRKDADDAVDQAYILAGELCALQLEAATRSGRHKTNCIADRQPPRTR